MTDDEISSFIASQEWTFAKTMPEIPHWYTLRRKANSSEGFSAFVPEIRFRGVQRPFGSKTFTYLDFDGWTYWTMGAPIEETILINRARLTGTETPPGQFRLGSGSESSSKSGSSPPSPRPSVGSKQRPAESTQNVYAISNGSVSGPKMPSVPELARMIRQHRRNDSVL